MVCRAPGGCTLRHFYMCMHMCVFPCWQGLLRTYSQYLQETEVPAVSSSSGGGSISSSSAHSTLTAPAATAAPTWFASSTMRANPLFSSSSSSSGEQELLVHGGTTSARHYSTLGSTTNAGASSSTATAVRPLNLEDFSLLNTLSNPIYTGRAALKWLALHSTHGGSACSSPSAAGGLAATAAAGADSRLPAAISSLSVQQPQQELSGRPAEAASTGASSGLRCWPWPWSRSRARSEKIEGAETTSSSLPSNTTHSLASTGFSTDSEALGQVSMPCSRYGTSTTARASFLCFLPAGRALAVDNRRVVPFSSCPTLQTGRHDAAQVSAEC